jgi:nucleotide-binding universal stress UspA family protein
MSNSGQVPGHHIVVGLDGSESSMQALDWAIRQAQLTDASVLVVVAWHIPTSWGWGMAVAPATLPQQDAEKMLEDVLEPVRQKHPGVAIESRVTEGHPAAVLVDASRGADLVVVGSRGHGEFAGMLLGSVSEHCVSNAHCPVVVLRGNGS